MSQMDYDLNQPKHTPIIMSILVTIVLILVMTFGLILYFQGSLKQQESKNELKKANSFNLSELKKWENNYFKSENEDKINLDDAIYITISRYNR